jgi:hypothetical protein
MSQFTNWLIETHPEYIKGSRILEQMFGRGLLNPRNRRSIIKEDRRGTVTNYICPIEIFDAIRRLKREGYIKYPMPSGEMFWITESMRTEAININHSYHPISLEDFEFSAKEREQWKTNNGETDEDINQMLGDAKKYMGRTTMGALAGYVPGWWGEARTINNAMKRLMEWKKWEWKEVTFPPSIITLQDGSNVSMPSITFPGVGNRNLLVVNKKTFDDTKLSDEKRPKYGTDTKDPSETPKPVDDTAPKPPDPPSTTPPAPGAGAPGAGAPGGATASGAPPGSLWDDDYKERIAQLKKTNDALKQKEAEIVQREKEREEKRKKEAMAKAAAGGAGAAAVGTARPTGRGGAGGAGGGGAGGGAGAGGAGGGGAAPGAFSPDDIFGREPEKVNPQRIQLEPYHLKNRKGISDTMTKVVNHFSTLGLDVYSRGGKLFVLDDAVDDPSKALLYSGFIDNTNTTNESPIWKQLWKASLQPNIRMRLNGKDLQQILGEMGTKFLDNFDNPDDMKTADPYRGKRQVYNADDLNKGSQFWRMK